MKKLLILSLFLILQSSVAFAQISTGPRDGCYKCYVDCESLGLKKGDWYCPQGRSDDDNLEDMPGGDKPHSSLT
jgi:hypothetical protein